MDEKILKMWDELEAMGICSQALELITDINGQNIKTMHDILFCYSGERMFKFEELEVVK